MSDKDRINRFSSWKKPWREQPDGASPGGADLEAGGLSEPAAEATPEAPTMTVPAQALQDLDSPDSKHEGAAPFERENLPDQPPVAGPAEFEESVGFGAGGRPRPGLRDTTAWVPPASVEAPDLAPSNRERNEKMSNPHTPDTMPHADATQETIPEATLDERLAAEEAAQAAEIPLAQTMPTPELVENTIKNHVIAAMGVGLVPLPVFDVAAVVAVQVKMVHTLTKMYGVPYNRNMVRGSILSLIGGILPVSLGLTAVSLIKTVPGLGTVSGAVGVVVLAGALTYAVGRVFSYHLASGETLLTFNVEQMRDKFRSEFERGKTVAQKLRPTKDAEPGEAAVVADDPAVSADAPASAGTSETYVNSGTAPNSTSAT